MKITDINVQLTDYMGNDLSVVNAARVSFDKESDWEVTQYEEGSRDVSISLKESDKKLIKYLAEHNHWSPFSHAFASFRIKAPIFVARQLVKHTVGLAWNEVSRRYVDNEPEFYLPEYWRARAESVKQGSSDEAVENFTTGIRMDDSIKICDHAERVNYHALDVYTRMLEAGVCAEQARMILPQNMMTEWIWSGSLYAFARVCNLRLDSHTQRETQEVAKLIDKAMKEIFPVSWEVLVK
jgi:thymidylate synthase (FAD)